MKVKACSALVSAENHAALPKHRSFRRERCWPCGGAAMKSQINSRNCLMRRHSSALLESGTAWAGLDEGSVTSAMFSESPASALVPIAADLPPLNAMARRLGRSAASAYGGADDVLASKPLRGALTYA